MKDLAFTIELDRIAAKSLVQNYHYSGKLPSTMFSFVCSIVGEPVASCCFGMGAARWKLPVLELTRLVVDPSFRGLVTLSSFVAQCISYLKINTHHTLLISYADPHHGHHGGIYQALSWDYHGREKGNPGIPFFMNMITGEQIHRRTLNAKYGTSAISKVKAILGNEWEPQRPELKHLYWKALNKPGKRKAKLLELHSNPYMKPDNDHS